MSDKRDDFYRTAAMIFSTRPEYEFKFVAMTEALQDPPGTQHWCAFEWFLQDFWFVFEFLTEQGTGKDRLELRKTFCCTQLSPILDLVRSGSVLDHRISPVIPADASPAGQIELKPIQAIYSCGDDTYELVTRDAAQYVWPRDNVASADAKTEIYVTD